MPFIEIPLEYWLLIAGIIIVGLSWACCRLYEIAQDRREIYKIATEQEAQISFLSKVNQGLLNRINAIHRQYKK